MAYAINFSKQADKNLEKIKDPFYSAIKIAIMNIFQNLGPYCYKKLVGIAG